MKVHGLMMIFSFILVDAPEAAPGRVVILGAGLHGAALAYYLTRRGVKPLIVEREKVAAAASGKGGHPTNVQQTACESAG